MQINLKRFQPDSLASQIVWVTVTMAVLLYAFGTENYAVAAVLGIPVLVAAVLMDYKTIFALLVFSLPFSLSLRIESINLNIALPSEPLIGLLAGVCLVFLTLSAKKPHIIRHPITIILFMYWAGLFLSLVFSSMPEVSVKSFIVASCYLLVFYFLTAWYIDETENVKKLFWLYGLSLGAIIINTTMRHYDHGFNKSYSATASLPFFSDHTIYGVCVAFLSAVFLIFFMKSAKLKISYGMKLLSGILLVMCLVAVYLSHSRATWLSLGGILVMLLILRLRIPFAFLVSIASVVVIVVAFNSEIFMPALLKNKYDSKAKRANLEEQIRSVTNIKNDVSNAERVNRWLCAVRMFEEKPLTGYGIGTYQFKYITYQKGAEMTEISITSAKNNYSQGMGGTAHSEYLLALSESGIITAAAIVLLVLYSIYTGMNLYYHSTDEIKYTALMVMLGLITYFVHGVFNNFLTTDKAAFLVWASLAVLTVLDDKHKKRCALNLTKAL